MNSRSYIFGLALVAIAALAMPLAAAAQAPAEQSAAAAATEAQKRHEELAATQALDRLQQAEKNIGDAISALQNSIQQAGPQGGNSQAPSSAPAAAAVRPAAIQQAEQALHDVRRAIDEIRVEQERRQRVLDRLDDADSAMRMARQPEARDEKQRLAKALEAVQQEVKLAQNALPAAPKN